MTNPALTRTGGAARTGRRSASRREARPGSHGFHSPQPGPAAAPADSAEKALQEAAPAEPVPEQVLYLPVGDLRPNPRQPRRNFDRTALEELAASVRRHGILQPLTVRRAGRRWELVSGERRLRAAKLAGLETVPCLVLRADSGESAVLALVENIQRRNLHYLEEAEAIAKYMDSTGAGREETAARLGRSPSYVAARLRLLRLSPACRRELMESGLSEGSARALLRLPDEDSRLNALRHMAKRGLSAAQSERYVRRLLKEAAPPARRRTFILKDVRLFLNTVTRGVEMVREAGVDVQTRRLDTDDAILLAFRIPRGGVR